MLLLYENVEIPFGSINLHAADDRHLPRARLGTKIQQAGALPVSKASDCGSRVVDGPKCGDLGSPSRYGYCLNQLQMIRTIAIEPHIGKIQE